MAHFLEVVFWSEAFWRGAQKPWRTWELRGIEPAGSSAHSCGTCTAVAWGGRRGPQQSGASEPGDVGAYVLRTTDSQAGG